MIATTHPASLPEATIKAANGLTVQRHPVHFTAEGRIARQRALISRPTTYEGRAARATVEIRFDDSCKNGHESFTITGDISYPGRKDSELAGCIHEEIRAIFPELAPALPYHLVSKDGPMHYITNAVYHARTKWTPANPEHFRSHTVWPELSDEDAHALFESAELIPTLEARLPSIIEGLRQTVEACGLVWEAPRPPAERDLR